MGDVRRAHFVPFRVNSQFSHDVDDADVQFKSWLHVELIKAVKIRRALAGTS